LTGLPSTLTTTIPERRRPSLDTPPSVSVEGLSKTFRLPHQHYSTMKERVLHPFRSRTFDELHAVQDVSFSVHEGEFFGIVGRNGSGKSTLLKCLAGIYQPDAGRASVRGRLSPFIELGVGFNPDLTARDNVIINAVMLGLSRRQARERFDDIIACAELEEFLDLKLKNYSSGMSVRLAFSVAIQVDADVLLVDEVLAVGDAAFQQKCFEEFDRIKRQGKTIIFVTHDMGAVERFCDRALLMERGRLVSIDKPAPIARQYTELNFGRLTASANADGLRHGDHVSAEIGAAWFEDRAGERLAAVGQGDAVRMCMEVTFHDVVQDPVFTLHLRNDVRHTVFATASTYHEVYTGRYESGDSVVVRVEFENWLAVGRYHLTPTVALPGEVRGVLDMREDLASLYVHGRPHTGGVIEPPHTFEIDRT
jgi:ABC-type polysaccharide/polyol phosphate transport system ATPase subunit